MCMSSKIKFTKIFGHPPMSQGNAAGGVVHEMVLTERWPPENRNLFNLILIGNVEAPIRHWF